MPELARLTQRPVLIESRFPNPHQFSIRLPALFAFVTGALENPRPRDGFPLLPVEVAELRLDRPPAFNPCGLLQHSACPKDPGPCVVQSEGLAFPRTLPRLSRRLRRDE